MKAKFRGEKKPLSSRNRTAFWETNGPRGASFLRGRVSRGKAVFSKSKSHCSLENGESAGSVVLAKPSLAGKSSLFQVEIAPLFGKGTVRESRRSCKAKFRGEKKAVRCSPPQCFGWFGRCAAGAGLSALSADRQATGRSFESNRRRRGEEFSRRRTCLPQAGVSQRARWRANQALQPTLLSSRYFNTFTRLWHGLWRRPLARTRNAAEPNR